MNTNLEREWRLADDGFVAGTDYKTWLALKVVELRALLAAATHIQDAAIQRARAESLEQAAQIAERHKWQVTPFAEVWIFEYNIDIAAAIRTLAAAGWAAAALATTDRQNES